MPNESPEVQRLIEAERQRYEEAHPGADALPSDRWVVLPDEGHRGHFTEDEVARAGEFFLTSEQAAAYARELYSEDSGAGLFFPEEMLSALSLLSESAAERARLLLRERPEEAQRRIEVFRRRLDLWEASGRPQERFPS